MDYRVAYYKDMIYDMIGTWQGEYRTIVWPMIGTFQWWVDPGYSACSVPTIPCRMNLHGLPLTTMLDSPLIATQESSMPFAGKEAGSCSCVSVTSLH